MGIFDKFRKSTREERELKKYGEEFREEIPTKVPQPGLAEKIKVRLSERAKRREELSKAYREAYSRGEMVQTKRYAREAGTASVRPQGKNIRQILQKQYQPPPQKRQPEQYETPGFFGTVGSFGEDPKKKKKETPPWFKL